MKFLMALFLLVASVSCDYRKYPQEQEWKKEIQEMQEHPGPYQNPGQDQQEDRRK